MISQKSKKNRKHDKPKRVIERQHRDARAKKENKAKKDNGFVYVPDKGIVPKFEQKSKDKQWENDINDHMYEAQKLKTDGYRDRKSNDDAQKHKTDRYDRKSSDFIDYVPKRYSDYKSSDYLEDAQKNKPDRYRDNDRKYSDYKSSDRYLDNDRKSNDYVESKADRYRDYDRKYSDNRRDSGDYPSKSGKYRENKIDYGYDDVSYTTRR